MFTITLTIGRNLGKAAGADAGKPMDDAEWNATLAAAEDILRGAGGEGAWIERHIGIGEWEGVAEESAKVAIIGADLATAATVRARVARLAEAARQDAIALAIGTSELVLPVTP